MAWINCLNTALQITASNKNAQNLISIATALQAWERSRICPSHVLFCTNVPCSLFSGLHIHCTNRKQTLSMHTVNVWNNTYKYHFLHTAVINMFDLKLFWLPICSDLLACGYCFWSISKKLMFSWGRTDDACKCPPLPLLSVQTLLIFSCAHIRLCVQKMYFIKKTKMHTKFGANQFSQIVLLKQ